MRVVMLVIAVLVCSGRAFAEDAEESGAEPAADSETAKSAHDSEAGDSDSGGAADTSASAEGANAGTPIEPPSWWFGAYFQGGFVPSAMLKLFLDDAPTVGSPAFGLTATHRDKSGFSIVLGLGYAGYGFGGPFRIKGDPEQDTEYITSTIKLVHLRAEMLWSTELVKDTLSFEYGVGLDLAVVLGELRRSEAYRPTPGADFQPCAGALAPPTPSPAFVPYCEPPLMLPTDAYNAHGAQYNVVEKRVPPVLPIPMLPVLALRYTPTRQLAVKVDAAVSFFMQFAFGVSVAYGPDL
jgi:hypothetical protein